MYVDKKPRTVEEHPDVHVARFPGLDGLRSIAVSAVVLFHADFTWARGGYLGVDLFFVISGFLITSLIAREVEATGHLRLRAFYWRRAKRLLPASLLMTACVVAAAGLFAPDALSHLRQDTAASLAYVTNWELLHRGTSYFEAMGRPPLLQHLWSLAVEEQFYILWAPLCLVVLPRFGRMRLMKIAIALAIGSVLAMEWMAVWMGYPGQGDPSRLYFGTDTHGFALLLGAALGLGWQPRRDRAAGVTAHGFAWLVGLAALAGMVFLFVTMGENTPWLYPWGFLLASGTSIALIATATYPGVAVGRCLDTAPMRWIGARSYGIYLWHWPIFMLTRPDVDLSGWSDNGVFVLRVLLTLALAECSYRYIELPVRRGFLERTFAGGLGHAWRTRLSVVSLAAGALLITGNILREAPIKSLPAQNIRETLELDIPKRADVASSKPAIPPVVIQVAGSELESARSSLDADIAPLSTDEWETTAYSGAELTVVGDSVMLGSSRLLKNLLPGTDIHATMGWQAADILRQIRTLQQTHMLRSVVVVHLGTNGYVTEDQLRRILKMLSDRERVVLINTRVPRRWMEPNNALIDRVAPDFPNVRVVRWNDMSDGKADYFISDRVHLTAAGQRALLGDVMRTGHLEHHTHSKHGGGNYDVAKSAAPVTGDASPTLVFATPLTERDAYWRNIAQCETESDWHDETRLLGGLDIGLGAWKAWGGEAFAATPSDATPEQQIEVAGRISERGWTNASGGKVPAIGFDHWTCVSTIGYPPSTMEYTYTRESVLKQTFHLGDHGEVVRDLQRILGVTRNGVYDAALSRKHAAYLEKNAAPEGLAATDS